MDQATPTYSQGVTKVLHESTDSIYYYSVSEKYPTPILIKMLKSDNPDPAWQHQFYNEYEITKELSIKGVRRAYAIDTYEGKPCIILEFVEGRSIKDFIKEKKWTLHQFLRAAVQITQILHEIHEHNIIHKDINSKNILIDEQKGEVHIVDFGISTRVSLKTEQLINPDQLEGTLAYLSPEQTGRMNRYVDYRTDFYSLGITFYEMLSGTLPFQGDDAVEMVHSHIAKNAPPLHSINPEIPRVLSDIVDKLLSKNAEDRYQSALGIKADLNKCLEQLEVGHFIEDFAIAQNDFSGRFQIPQKLYGRDHEMSLMMEVFRQTCEGKRNMVVISGYSGVGKTAVVHEIRKFIIEQDGHFIEGKFDQFQRNTPHFAFLQAFNAFVNQLLTESADHMETWRNRIQNAVGDNGKVLTEIFPNIEVVIGAQPELQKLDADGIQNRFNYTFKNFVKSITSQSHPLVIFIDDVQWADAASLNLIRQLMTEESMEHLLLITAHRENEVSAGHPLLATLAEIKEQAISVDRIFLKGLDVKHVNDLVADTLNAAPEQTRDLSYLVFHKTEGNPFFINEFLKTLYTSNAVVWNSTRNEWFWNLDELRAIDVTDNVVHFLSEKMQKLSRPAYHMLQFASCIGNRFSVSLLGELFKHPYARMTGIVYEAVEEGYIAPLLPERNGTYAEKDSPDIIYKFTHDQVQQALYSRITDEEKSAIHLSIGTYLLDHGNAADDIFRITDHLNNARGLITPGEEIDRLGRLNYEAGLKAKNNNAHEAALNYFRTATSLLSNEHWNTSFEFIFNATLERAEAEYINRHPIEAEETIDFIFGKARNGIEKAVVLEKKILLYGHLGKLQEGLEIGRKALSYLGVNLPTGNAAKKAGIAIQLLKANRNMRNMSGDDILNLPELNSKEGKALTSLVGFLFMTLYYTDPELFIFMALYMANYSIKNGNSSLSPLAYVSLSIVNAAFFQKYKKAYDLSRTAFDLNEKFPNGTVKGRLMLNYTGGIYHWVKPARDVIEQLYAGYKVCMESGDHPYAVDTVIVNLSMQLFSGRSLPALLEEFEDYSSFIERSGDFKQQQEFLLHMTQIKNLITEKKDFIEAKGFDDIFLRNNRHQFTLGYFYHYRAFYYLLMGEAARALEFTTAAMKILNAYKASIAQAQEVLYHALALAASYHQANDSLRRKIMKDLQSSRQQYKKWSESCPENFSHAYALICAEISRIKSELETSKLYHRAIALARDNKFISIEAYACERLGEYCLEQDLKEAGYLYFKEAINLYERWGAVAKVNMLRESHPSLRIMHAPVQAISFEESLTHAHTTTHKSEMLDMMTVLKSSTAISREIRIEKLLDVLMKIVLENAGAQEGFFILPNENKFLFRSADEKENAPMQDLEFLESDKLPDTIVKYVSRTNESVVLDDSENDSRFASDPYIKKNKPKSVLCAPILSKGKLIALLYLENNLIDGAFGPNRLELLKILSGQIAVSIENSLLYENLEQKVIERTLEIVKQKEIVEQEKNKSDKLLQNILPVETAEELKSTGTAQPRRFEMVTVMFTDFINFTKTSEVISPDVLVDEINLYYSKFDEIISKYGLEKIKTIGDSYMCVGGLPKIDSDNPVKTVKAALEIQEFIAQEVRQRKSEGRIFFEARIGINTGPVVAGIVGTKKFAYDIWGDTVNIASKMEARGESGRVNISGTTYDLIRNTFSCTYRGKMEAKNKGLIDMYFVDEPL